MIMLQTVENSQLIIHERILKIFGQEIFPDYDLKEHEYSIYLKVSLALICAQYQPKQLVSHPEPGQPSKLRWGLSDCH